MRLQNFNIFLQITICKLSACFLHQHLIQSVQTSGLKWVLIGDKAPDKGRNLEHAELAAALAVKTEFTAEEWESFGVQDLRMSHFVKVGRSYFCPLYSMTRMQACTVQ